MSRRRRRTSVLRAVAVAVLCAVGTARTSVGAPEAADAAEAQKKARAAFKPLDLPALDKVEKQVAPSLPPGIVTEPGPFDALVSQLQKPYEAPLEARAEALKALAEHPAPAGGDVARAASKVLAKEDATLAERVAAVEKEYAEVYNVEWTASSEKQKQTRKSAATLIPHYRTLQKRSGETAALLSEALAAMARAGAQSLEWVASAATADADPALRGACVEALGRAAVDGGLAPLKQALSKDAVPAVRLRALAALCAFKTSSVADAFTTALADPAWEVRALAAEACVRANLVEAAPAMIAALEKEGGRLRKDLDDALFALVGARMYGDADLWKRWWADHREEVEKKAKDLAAAGEREKALGHPSEWLPRDSADSEDEKRKGGTSAFYGITTLSKRVLFVIDISKSMEEATQAVPPTTGDPKHPYARPTGNARIDVARWQLHRAIHDLPADASFGVAVYSESYALWPETMAVAAPKTKTKAHAFVDAIRVNGTTNICDPLDRAFEAAGAPLSGGGATVPGGRAVDTVYLLSDGDPNRGRVSNLSALLDEVLRRNRTAGLVIHAVGIGEVAGSSFLESLAKKNGGRYVGFK